MPPSSSHAPDQIRIDSADHDADHADDRTRLSAGRTMPSVLHLGRYAWAAVGLGLFLFGAQLVVSQISVVVVPLILALFPAAVLAPLVSRLKARGVPGGLAALIVLVAALAVIGGVGALLASAVNDQFADLGASLQQGYEQLRDFLAAGAFGVDAVALDQLVDRLAQQVTAGPGSLAARAAGTVAAVATGLAQFVLFLFALFFYLKDGGRIAAWVRDLFPRRLRADATAIGERAWGTIGAYIRGQLLIALADATLIGAGLLVLGVPLVLPLTVLVFIGGLFPIIGAILAGFVAVLVAFASGGITEALLVLALIVIVQQLEGHLLQPIIMGRATALHPLAVISSLTIGSVILGVLGAFLSVPVAASIARAAGYLRERPAAP